MTGSTSKTIFLIEDDENTIQVINSALENEGFKVEVARDGEQALEVLRKGFKADLILLDLVIPKVSGFKVLEFLNKKGSKIPVVVLSNLGQDKDIEKALSLGAKDYLTKSTLSLKEVLEKIRGNLKY